MAKFTKDNTHLYYGFYKSKVVDIDDEFNRGRVQVRVMGLHSQNNVDSLEDGIPDENLPWAEQAAPLFGGFAGEERKPGITLVPAVNSWVWVFFDNGNYNYPVYFASIIGNNDRQTSITGENLKDDVTKILTKSGHVIEINDTETNPRIVIKHNNNAVIAISMTPDEKPLININAREGSINIEGGNINIGGVNGGYPILWTNKNIPCMINGQTFAVAQNTKIG